MIVPLGVLASLLFFGRKRKRKEERAFPAKKPATRVAGEAFDLEFSQSEDEDAAAEKAIEAYQRAGGSDPEFIAQIQYWTGSR